MTTTILATTCPPWCDGKCREDDAPNWRHLHTQDDTEIPAVVANYSSETLSAVLVSLIRKDNEDGSTLTRISMGIPRGSDDVRLDLGRARELVAELVHLIELGEAS